MKHHLKINHHKNNHHHKEPESQTTLQDTGMGETMRNITYSHTKKKLKKIK